MIKIILVAFSVATLAATSLFALVGVDTSPQVAAATVGPNLIANPSVEQAASATLPAGWKTDKWGTNTSAFTYATTGHVGTRSVGVKISTYKSGDAKWFFEPVGVVPATSYTYSDWYTANVTSEIDIVVTNTAGKVSYLWQGTLPASATWRQAVFTFKAPANAKTVTAYHYLHKVGELTTDDHSLTQVLPTPTSPAPAPTPPSVTLTAPTANTTIAGLVAVTAQATDAQAVTKVQFKLDGNNLGAADTSLPYSVDWNTVSVPNGPHTLTAVATNLSNLTTTALNTVVTVKNPSPPTVSLTLPAKNSGISGTQTVTATAGGDWPITSVQFKMDNTNLGPADTTPPYSVDWDTTGSINGPHTLTAIATNSTTLATTSSPVPVTVNNVPPPVPEPVLDPTPTPAVNLIQNPSVELNTSGSPTGWQNGNWGNNTAVFIYNNTGHTGTHSLTTTITAYTDGAANWSFTPVAVLQNTTYAYSNWYQSTVDTEIDVEVTLADNTTQYFYLTVAPASPGWTQVTGTFTTPANAVSATFYQLATAVGTVTSDDFSLTQYTPAQFTRGLVSLTFDDGWQSIYANGLPALTAHGMLSTQYLLTDTISYPEYMTVAMMQAFKDAGHEIASHTISHPHLPTLTAPQLDTELSGSQSQLRTWFGTPGVAENFATPFGEYNASVIAAIKTYYRSHRSTDVGFNSKDAFDIYNIKVQNIYNTTTPEAVQAWIEQALAQKTWLVLVYHEITDTASGDDALYATTPALFAAQLDKVQASGITVKTVGQALDEIVPQL